MRKRSERQQDFEAIKQDLFTAGVATVKAAQAQKNMYMTSLEALSEAYEGAGANLLEAGEEPEADLASLLDTLLTQRQTALTNQDSPPTSWGRLTSRSARYKPNTTRI
jgi:hypothetical protein